MSTIAIVYTRSDRTGEEKRNLRGPEADAMFKRFFENIAPKASWSGSNGSFTVTTRDGVVHALVVEHTPDPVLTRLAALP